MNCIRLIFTCIVSVCFSATVCAAKYNVVSELGASARSIALGNVEGFSDYATSIFSNPASLYRTRGYSLSFFTTNLMGEVDYSSICLNAEVGKGIVGFGLYDASVSEFIVSAINDDIDETLYAVSNFDYKSSIAKLSYQRYIRPKTSLGGSLSFFNHRYADVNGFGHNVDLGLVQHFEHFNVSVFAQNLLSGLPVSYLDDDASKEELPFLLSTSAQFFWKDLEFFPQIKHDRSHFLMSCGILYKPNPWPFLDLMFGYKEQLDAIRNRQSRATVGLGLTLANVSIYYAYERSDYFLMDHNSYFSINYVL